MLRNCFLLFFAFLLMSICGNSFALPFNIVAKSGTQLPTTVNKGSTVTAYYTINNLAVSQQNGNFIKYLPLNVTQVVTGGNYSDTCGKSFILQGMGKAGSSCTLQLTVSGPVNANDPDPRHHLFACFPSGLTCAGTTQSLNVTQISERSLQSITVTPGTSDIDANGTQQYAATGNYSDNTATDLTAEVSWASSNMAAATISATGLATGIAVGTTSITASFAGFTSSGAILSVANPMVSLAVTPAPGYGTVGGSVQLAATATYADNTTQDVTTLATWSSASPSFATVGTATGLVTGVAIGSSSITASYNGFMNSATFNVTTFAYFSNGNSVVSFCPVNSDGSLATCNTTAENTFLSSYAVQSSNDQTAMYISDQNAGSVFYCPIQGDGSLGACIGNTIGVASPTGLALNSAGTQMYVAYEGADVMLCSVNGSSITGCTATGTNFNGAYSVAVNPAGTFAYVMNIFNGVVSSCAINSDGTFGTCNIAANNFFDAFNVAVNPTGTTLYISSTTNGGLFYCPINSDGSLGTCNQTSPASNPNATAFNTSNTFAYIADPNSGGVYYCSVNNDGTLSNCNTTSSPGTAFGVALS